MTPERITLFDTTLREGQQTRGVQFSTAEMVRIAHAHDAPGVDHIEGRWPGANPTDSDFFTDAPQTRAAMTAFPGRRDGTAEAEGALHAQHAFQSARLHQ